MTIDTAPMEDIQAKAEELRLQLSSLHFNSAAPPPNQDLYNNNTENNFGYNPKTPFSLPTVRFRPSKPETLIQLMMFSCFVYDSQ